MNEGACIGHDHSWVGLVWFDLNVGLRIWEESSSGFSSMCDRPSWLTCTSSKWDTPIWLASELG